MSGTNNLLAMSRKIQHNLSVSAEPLYLLYYCNIKESTLFPDLTDEQLDIFKDAVITSFHKLNHGYRLPTFNLYSNIIPMPRILTSYILREIAVPFALGIAVLTITALLNKIVKLLELFFSGYAELRHLLLFIAAAMPTFLIYVIPAAFLAATLIAVTRMSSDSEMTALRAGGISLYPVMKPVLIFASAAFAITLFMTLFLYPWGNRTVKEVFYEVAGKSASSLVEENTFYNRFKGVIFYAEGISQADGSLKGILMSRRDEKGEQTLITAERGEFLSRRENTAIAIRLENGEAHKKTGKDGVYHLMSFSSYTLELDLEGNAGNQERVRPPRELYTNELLKRIKETGPSREKRLLLLDFGRRLAIPFSVFAFALIAVPLGMQRVRQARFAGIGIAIAILTLYYILSKGFDVAAETGFLNPIAASFGPFLAISAIGAFLFRMALKEKHFSP
ncbi:MAG: LPS export ABC transporter permease LptF, partial [Deltaproteobacteria bacterium]